MSEELKVTLKTIGYTLLSILIIIGIYFFQVLKVGHAQHAKSVMERICIPDELGIMVFENRFIFMGAVRTTGKIETLCECAPANFKIHQLDAGQWACFSSRYMKSHAYIRPLKVNEEKSWRPIVEKYKNDLENDITTSKN